jgi:arsenate reductase
MKRSVLFVCTGNRARSQMGEALLRHLAGDRFDVHSAGTRPGGLADETVWVMREIGIDASGQRSQHVDEFLERDFDYVITVCDDAKEACPVFPGGGERIHWNVEDPSDTFARGGTLTEAFRVARDDLRARIEQFVRETAVAVDQA